MEGTQEKKWFVYLTDHHEGPFSLEEIQGKMDRGAVTPQNYVWADGMSDWQPMPSVSAFESLLNKPKYSETLPPPISIVPAFNLQLQPDMAPTEEPQIVLPVLEPKPDSDPQIILPTLEPQITSSEPSVDPETAATQGAPQTAEEAPPLAAGAFAAPMRAKKTRRLWVGLLILLIPVAFGAAYFTGLLQPVLNSPTLKAGTQAVSDFIDPFFLKLVSQFPALGKWVSPLPPLHQVAQEEYASLRASASTPIEGNGPKIEIALSKEDPLNPSFYIATNLPDGTNLEVLIEGVPESLLNHLSFSNQSQIKVSQKLAKTNPIRFADGRPIPKGEYWIYVFESDEQASEVKNLLAAFQPTTVPLPNHLPKGLKAVAKKSVFLGGPKDALYAERLQEFHAKLREKATAELNEIRQFTQTLDSQMASTLSEFGRLRKITKASSQQKKSWLDFHNKWNQLDTQLKDSFMKWTPEALQREYFFGSLYALVQDLGQGVNKLHALHHSFFSTAVDLKSFEIQLGELTSQAMGSLTELRSKVEQAEKVSLAPGGMPRKEGL